MSKILLFESFSEKSKIIKDIEDHFYIIEELGYEIQFIDKGVNVPTGLGSVFLEDDDPCDIAIFIRMTRDEFLSIKNDYRNGSGKNDNSSTIYTLPKDLPGFLKFKKNIEYFTRLLEDQLNDVDDKFYDVKVDFIMGGNVSSVIKFYLE